MLADDLDAMIAGMPHTMTWGATSFTVSLDDIARQDDANGIVGMFQSRDVGAYMKTVATMPDVGDTVVIGTATYRVTRRMTGPDGIGTQFTLQRKSA